MEDETLDSTMTGELSPSAKQKLKSSAGWVKVIAILGFIGGGLIAIGGLFTLFGSLITGLFTLLMAAIYIYMSVLLMKQAVAVSSEKIDMDTFADSYLKYWKIIVILLIVSVVLSIVSYSVIGFQIGSLSNELQNM